MAEKQSDHRRDSERKVVYSNALSERIGQFLGFLVAVAAIGSGVYLTKNDKPTEGLVAILSPIVALAGVFVYGKYLQRKELLSKNIQVKS